MKREGHMDKREREREREGSIWKEREKHEKSERQ